MTTSPADDTRHAWDQVAPGYDEFVTPLYFHLATEALRRAGLRSGMRLLDVASGSGAVSLAAACLGAKVTAVDISPVMIDRLKVRARQEGLEIEARVMDGHALGLQQDSFDITASEFGVMLFPDLPRGLREMVRVSKPGGQVVVVAFGSPTKIEFLQFFIGAVATAVTVPGPGSSEAAPGDARRWVEGRAGGTDRRSDALQVRRALLGLGDEQQPDCR
jgi:ubiquinone/menaquinone biosynthesis C-methylase UbiE